MKPLMKEGDDYMIVDDDIWKYVSDIYGAANDIMRFGVKTSEDSFDCIVETYLKRI